MKKVQDYYFKKAKKEKYPARSVYKLEEAQQKYHLLKKGDRVLDLGCNPGSWSIYAAKTVGPQGLVVGVDLQSTKKVSYANAAAIQSIKADIMDSELSGNLRNLCDSFDVVISDIGPQTSGNKWVDQQKSLTLARRTIEIAGELLEEDGNYYCKVFQGEDFPDFVEEVRRLFKKVKVVKPKSSRTESREVYVLGENYKKPIIVDR